MNIKRIFGNIIIFALFFALLFVIYWVVLQLPHPQLPKDKVLSKPKSGLCLQLETAPVCEVEIDYQKDLKKMIEEANFVYARSDYLATIFPVAGEGKIKRKLKIFHPDKHGSWAELAELEKELNQCGYRLGKIEELVVFSKSCFKDNLVSVIELGSLYLRPKEKLNEFAAIFNEQGGKWSLVTTWQGYNLTQPTAMFLITEK